MKDLTSQQIFNITAAIFKEHNLPEPRKIWLLQDIFSEVHLEKGLVKNQHQIVIFFRVEGKESQSIRIEAVEEAEYQKKLLHIITTDIHSIIK